MRKLLSFITISFVIFLGIFTILGQNTSLAYDPHNPWWVNDNIPYCQNEKDCGIDKWLEEAKEVTGWLVESGEKPLSEYIIDIVTEILKYVTLVAVLFVLYSWFRIMTSNGDENTVKTARTSIIYVLIGIIVMWLAYAIVMLVIGVLKDSRNAYVPPQKPYITFNLIAQAHAQDDAIYSESEQGTFNEYKSRLNSKLQDLMAELRVNKEVNLSSLNEIKNLLEEAYKRLPDKSPTDMETNKGKKKLAIIAIDVAKRNPKSSNKVKDVVNTVWDFLWWAKISKISWGIEASPSEWNAPLTVSFRANDVSDPAGTTPNNNNYIWWKRNNSGQREDLGRGPSFMHTFEIEWSHTVFLDIKSSSRNQFGYTDVLPITLSQRIEVKPKLWEIILFINGVNVNNKSSVKITPEVASRGLIFDATASRAIWNGIIKKTRWDFWNGNSEEYNGSPGIERQAYSNEGKYPLVLEFVSNTGKKFKKEVQIDIRNPAAVIKVDKTRVLVWEKVDFSLDSFFDKNTQNVEYNWNIAWQWLVNKVSWMGENFSYSFENPGEYTVTLAAKSPNGSIDADSRIITVESRKPIVNIDIPKPVDQWHPNTLIFDGSKSFDPDINSREWLSYKWRVNWKDKKLDNTSLDWARGTLTFDEVWSYTVSLTVTNKYWKVATSEQDFEVKSLLSVDMKINPEVTQIKKPIRFVGQSSRADFYEWDFWDGSANVNGNNSQIEHTYKETGIYTVKLTVRTTKNDSYNTITRRVYVTDTDKPFALITASNASNSIIEESWLCQDTDAFTVNRSEPTTFDAGKSINIDGKSWNLSYTWRYMGKINTSQTVTETFWDLGCFPISLTVRSDTNGASYTTEKYIYLKNQLPQLTSITTQIDERKKDSRKIIVNVKANGVKDPDGVVTAYTWYYKTETDPEPQSLQITQKPEITFVLPNITEKYYFWVVLQDNDNGKVNSEKILQKQSPLIIDNANGNVYLPLISLSPSKTTAKVNESIKFTASATTILGSNITNKSEYAWDFDGDGHIDTTTQEPYVDHAYKRAGSYNMKVRVTYNGVSNVKYQTITIRNTLKASLQAYRLENALYLINTSQGTYDASKWKFWEYTADSLYSALIPYDKIPLADDDWVIGELSVSYDDSEVDTVKIRIRDAKVPLQEGKSVVYQSSIQPKDDTLHITSPSQGLGLSFYWNDPSITRYALDTDLETDSDLNGNPADDIDNKDHPSYKDGSFFRIAHFSKNTKKEHTLKITLFEGKQIKAQQKIKLILDFIPETTDKWLEMETFGSGTLSDFERKKINTLAELIRSIEDDTDRIIIMKKYNVLVENWNNSFEKAKALVDIQELIVDTDISHQRKSQITNIIDELLIGDANNINNITVAAQLVRDLIPVDNANRPKIHKNLEEILSHIDDYEENRKLAREILTLIENDKTIPVKYKEYIKSQLVIIIEKWEKQLPKKMSNTPPKREESGGFMGIIMGIIKVFLFIIGLIVVVIWGAYIFYRVTRKNSKLAFQDFMIDSVFHAGKKKKETESSLAKTNIPGTTITTGATITPEWPTQKTPAANDPLMTKSDSLENSKNVSQAASDPLTSFEAPKKQDLPPNAPNQESNTQQEESMPDWLKWANKSSNTTPESGNTAPVDPQENATTNTLQPTSNIADTVKDEGEDVGMPDWLKPESWKDTPSKTPLSDTSLWEDTPAPTTQSIIEDTTLSWEAETPIQANTVGWEDIPDWLKSDDTKNVPEDKTEPLMKEWEKKETEDSQESLQEDTKDSQESSEESTHTSISIDKEVEDIQETETEKTEEDKDIPDWLLDESTSQDEDTDDSIPHWLVEEEKKMTATKEENENPSPPEDDSKKQEDSSIEIEDTGTLEDKPETNLVDTAMPNDEVEIIEDVSLLGEDEKKTETKDTKTKVQRKKTQTKKTQTKKSSTNKTPRKTTKKNSTQKKSTKAKWASVDTIPDWLK